MAKNKKQPGVIADNRKARFEYLLTDALECGIVLCGTEVKSLRSGQIAFRDSFCSIEEGKLWLHNLHIAPYGFAQQFNHASDRKRGLLAKRREIDVLHRKVREKGYSLVPVKLYFKGSLIKVEIALGKGKKLYDKRDNIRERDLDRDAGRQERGK